MKSWIAILISFNATGDWSPFWSGETMTDEPIMFITSSDGAKACANLLFSPVAPPVLRQGPFYFSASKDYLWSEGSRSICLTPRSAINPLPHARLHPWRKTPSSIAYFKGTQWRYVMHSDHGEFQKFQVLANYKTTPKTWPGVTHSKGILPKTSAVLAMNRPLTLVVVGDSITVGEGASGAIGIPPLQPGYAERVKKGIESISSSRVTLHNHAMSGEVCEWGQKVAQGLSVSAPVLFILAFGMNDGAVGRDSRSFGACIEKQLELFFSKHPQGEFILVSNMPANPNWSGDAPELFPKYRDELLKLEKSGVVVADVFEAFREILLHKKHLDLTGNGVNHPNDFGHRVYADVILSRLRPSRVDSSPSSDKSSRLGGFLKKGNSTNR